MATLFRDLADRGMLDKTLVVVTGEFGRTPRINKNAGRDHWGPSFTVALGGGGVKGGRVIGASDARAETPADEPHGPEDLAATMYHLLGIDPQRRVPTRPKGRPDEDRQRRQGDPGAAVMRSAHAHRRFGSARRCRLRWPSRPMPRTSSPPVGSAARP